MAYNNGSFISHIHVYGLWVFSTFFLYSRIQVERVAPLLGIALFATQGKEMIVEPHSDS